MTTRRLCLLSIVTATTALGPVATARADDGTSPVPDPTTIVVPATPAAPTPTAPETPVVSGDSTAIPAPIPPAPAPVEQSAPAPVPTTAPTTPQAPPDAPTAAVAGNTTAGNSSDITNQNSTTSDQSSPLVAARGTIYCVQCNVSVVVRIASPGDDGAVAQVAGAGQVVGATAAAADPVAAPPPPPPPPPTPAPAPPDPPQPPAPPSAPPAPSAPAVPLVPAPTPPAAVAAPPAPTVVSDDPPPAPDTTEAGRRGIAGVAFSFARASVITHVHGATRAPARGHAQTRARIHTLAVSVATAKTVVRSDITRPQHATVAPAQPSRHTPPPAAPPAPPPLPAPLPPAGSAAAEGTHGGGAGSAALTAGAVALGFAALLLVLILLEPRARGARGGARPHPPG